MSYQYYPTGAHTAAKMWGKFKRSIVHVCDPSAGKGNLIRHAKEGFNGVADEDLPWVSAEPDEEIFNGRFSTRIRPYLRKKFSDMREFSAVEIDLQHHASLKELGANILGYDFMQVQSLATVSQVIMNPPFSEGAAHVLHAWKCVYDAEIVAIINAESLRNPYSRDRQILCELIEKHGSVEFLKDEFVDDVERKTKVEIALIYLEKIPSRYFDMDSLLGDLKNGDDAAGDDIDPQVFYTLALPSNFIQDTVTRFNQAVQGARVASEAIAVAESLSSSLGITLSEMQAKGVGNEHREKVSPVREQANRDFKERYAKLKEKAWSQIIRSSLLTNKLSNSARRKVEASSSNIYQLEFSAANIHGFLLGVIESMGEIYQNMIVDLFDTILERSSDNAAFYKSWKSNQKHRVGVRIRKSRIIIPGFTSTYDGSLSYEGSHFLSDIDKVFGYLHGISEGYDGLVEGVKRNRISDSSRISTKFFGMRYYPGAGTLHLYPNSDSVVDKLNLFVGKVRNWIPGSMDDANPDFQKQYDKAESLTKSYMQKYSKSGRIGFCHPAFELLREAKGDNRADSSVLSKIEESIDSVHADLGIVCGPSLSSESSTKLKIASDKISDDLFSGQFLLLESN